MLLNKQLFILKLTTRNALYELYYLFIRYMVSSLSLPPLWLLFVCCGSILCVSVSFCQIVHVNITNNFAHTHTHICTHKPYQRHIFTLSYQGTTYHYT